MTVKIEAMGLLIDRIFVHFWFNQRSFKAKKLEVQEKNKKKLVHPPQVVEHLCVVGERVT